MEDDIDKDMETVSRELLNKPYDQVINMLSDETAKRRTEYLLFEAIQSIYALKMKLDAEEKEQEEQATMNAEEEEEEEEEERARKTKKAKFDEEERARKTKKAKFDEEQKEKARKTKKARNGEEQELARNTKKARIGDRKIITIDPALFPTPVTNVEFPDNPNQKVVYTTHFVETNDSMNPKCVSEKQLSQKKTTSFIENVCVVM